MIVLKEISKKFGKFQALENVNLHLKEGECVALIGPNGCGKTTLIKSILGMVVPDSGIIYFDGKSTRGDDSYRRHIGYMPQIGRYPDNMTIGQVVDMIRTVRNYPHATDNDLFREFDLESMSSKKMRTLSGGTVQKVSATLAFLFSPKVLILDEPTAGLDPLAAEILKQKIIAKRNEGCLILITSHLLNELEDLVTQVAYMQSGKLAFHEQVDTLKLKSGHPTVSKSIIHLLKNGALS